MSDMALKILFDCGRMTMKMKTLKDTSKIKSYKRLNNMLRWRDIRSMRNWYSKEGRESSNDTRRCSNLVVYGFRQIWTFWKESLLYITLTVNLVHKTNIAWIANLDSCFFYFVISNWGPFKFKLFSRWCLTFTIKKEQNYVFKVKYVFIVGWNTFWTLIRKT